MRTTVVVVAVVVLGVLGIISSCNAHRNAERPIYEEAPALTQTSSNANAAISNSRRTVITEVAAKCSPAIVGINVIEEREIVTSPFSDFFMDDPFFRYFFRGFPEYRQRQQIRSLGSGFIISPDGYIITNDHVAGRATKIVVTTVGGKKYDAEIIGSDPVTDVALLKINGEGLPYLRLGNSDDVVVGEWAIAFGNPFGLFDRNAKPTVTLGVVSNIGVNLVEPAQYVPNGKRIYRGMIQTDAAISSGNSGGPLVNANGDVIGVNTIIFSTATSYQGAGSIGIGFAIPINRVKRIINLLRSGKQLDRNFYTGLTVDFLDRNNRRMYNVQREEGIIVTQVMRNSPADKAGIEPGDVIVEIDGMPIHTRDDLDVAINDGTVGQTLTFVIERDGKLMTKTLVLQRRPQ
ncbi:MAG: trypsin-like peptidase domain-containing protein [Bacteroidota bacterium]|nr:trypsin-like peptidase domain-containing protein [Candidatus Kapabacteria bacterium]MCS7302070.1 trypsin-like peptidase domain-containing protein [Candidatus Kapabacteria bacterium]MCX7936538.1 trypsin-like peptidase domain-containing protein [Chlorobiota bacterium]MDW8074699.1 trypsin-like peptidase domain-containing protein [Bacteroidota bacterium]MDW8270825.1 trypsin-like peptidase domain-containing protein [Bacteroidota bacterium]